MRGRRRFGQVRRDTARGRLRQARVGVTTAFALAGALCGVFTARIPALMDELAISPASWAACCSCGASARSPPCRHCAGSWHAPAAHRCCAWRRRCTRWHSRWSRARRRTGSCSPPSRVFGIGFGAVEVSAKARRAPRPSGRTAARWSPACTRAGRSAPASAGLAAALCAHLGVSYTATLVGAAVVALPVAFALGRDIARHPRDRHTGPLRSPRRRIRPVVYLLGIIAFAALVIEGRRHRLERRAAP